MGGDVRSRAYPTANVQMGWLFVAALLLQFAAVYAQTAGTGGVFQSWMLIASYILLLAAVLANLRFWGFRLLLIGLSLNMLAMGLNGWRMPVTPESLSKAGYVEEASLAGGVDFRSPKSVVLNREDTRVQFLTDSVVLSWPTNRVVSVGDLVIVASVAVVLSELVLKRRRVRSRGRARLAPKRQRARFFKPEGFPGPDRVLGDKSTRR